MVKAVDEVRVGVDGTVWIAPFGTTAPAAGFAALTGAWKDLGYVSDEGVTEVNERSTEPIIAWQKAKKVRTVTTEGATRWTFALIQTSADTVGLYYGGTVDSEGIIIIDPSASRPTVAFVLDVIDGDEQIRDYAPEAQVTEVGDLVYQNGAAIGYEITIEAQHNEALGGSVKKTIKSLVEA